MKNGYSVNVKLSEDMVKKLVYICRAENRTPSAQFNLYLRNSIAYFERAKGRIPASELAKIDISEFADDKKE